MIAGKAGDIAEGMTMAREALDSGAATRVLDKLVQTSNAA